MDLKPVLGPVRELGEFIRDQRTAAGTSLRGLAAKAGVSNPYLSQVERGLRRPSADVLAQIAHGLSISVESLLAKAGVLTPGDAPEVVAAIRADEGLTERQKASLLDIYTAFRAETAAALDRASGVAADLADTAPTDAAPTRSTPTRSTPTRSTPTRSTPTRSTPTRTAQNTEE